MKITRIEPIAVDRYLFVRVHTDAGIVGLGESGAWGHLEASEAAIKKFAGYLVGQDPRQIEHHWNVMYRGNHFRGAAIMGAISAIDIALWDIKGKALGVPVYELLGGKCRDRVRVYCHIKAETPELMVSGCVEAREYGYTAVGHLNPFLDLPRSQPYFQTHAAKIGEAVDLVRRCREAVGDQVDLCVEIHRRLTPAEAVVLARGIEPYHPMFYEDPTTPDNFDAMAVIAQQIGIPIATGERLHTIYEFQMLLARNAVQYVRTSLGLCGGISGAKKIAALAEANQVGVIPHNPIAPVALAACLQLDASIPNFAIQEFPTGNAEDSRPAFGLRHHELIVKPFELEAGFVRIPDAPGIGVELIPDIVERFPVVPRSIAVRYHRDGSVVDQ
jgi:galactonate dehydratase